VKGRVEYRDMGESGQRAPRGLDPHQVHRVVQRRQDRQRANLRDHVVVDHDGLGETRSPVDDAVGDHLDPDGIYLAQCRGHGLVVVGHSAGLADALHEPRGERRTALEIDEAVLERR
jgi:hypothetical protein